MGTQTGQVDTPHRGVPVRGSGKKKFLVDIFHTYAYSVVVEASDEKEAEKFIEDAEVAGRLDPADFRKTDDFDINVYGEVDNTGPNPWPELEVQNGKKCYKVHSGK